MVGGADLQVVVVVADRDVECRGRGYKDEEISSSKNREIVQCLNLRLRSKPLQAAVKLKIHRRSKSSFGRIPTRVGFDSRRSGRVVCRHSEVGTLVPG